jgi:hypothetical protein
MAGPLPQVEQTHYGPLSMDRYLTGMWTQRSPLRDADVPYLYSKFYSASRFDSIIDGINREITARLTCARRPGSSTWSNFTYPAINTFYSFNAVNNTSEQIHVMADTASEVYEAKTSAQIYAWAKSAGAGVTRFLGVGPELFSGNGVDTKVWLQYGPWPGATQSVEPGTLITDTNSNVQLALGGITIPIVATEALSTTVNIYFNPLDIPDNFADLLNVGITFSGLTAGAALNGTTKVVSNIVSTTLGILTVTATITAYAKTSDTGSGTTGTGTTGSTQPTWSTTPGVVVADGGQQWKCMCGAFQNWGIAAPTKPPIGIPEGPIRYWQPSTAVVHYYTILDENQNIQVCASAGTTGIAYPNFAAALGGTTIDGTISWVNIGPIGSWQSSTEFGEGNNQSYVVLDTVGNLQWASTPGTTGTSYPPSWSNTLGGTCTDGSVTWTNVGGGSLVATESLQWAYSFEGVDGSVTTASPTFIIPGGILGPPGATYNGTEGIGFAAPYAADPQIKQVWWWRTAQGQSTLVLLDQQPANNSYGYVDMGIPDTSTAGGPSLDALIAAPIASANNPPPKGFTAPVQHMQRVWGFVGRTVYYSGGPDTLVGNGNTAFAPLSSFSFPELITKLIPFTTNNGGLLVCGTRNVYVILGTGTADNPFYDTTYMPTVGFLNYDAVTIVGSTLYGFTNNRKFISLDPSAGYVECGFPIGDQLQTVTTGGINSALYSATSTYVTWNERNSGDSGIYVSDGAVGWFRYSPVASPESGYLWSPRAAIVGGTSAVLSVETSPGIQTLLIGPHTSGPILQRDTTVFADNGTAYTNCYFTIGNIQLCESGEIAEVAHICLDSIRVGSQPTVGLLFGEIAATTAVPFDMLSVTSPDPPDLPQSQTLFSDRYVTMQQGGVTPKCRHLQIMFQWPQQSVQDELLTHTIFGAKFNERREG